MRLLTNILVIIILTGCAGQRSVGYEERVTKPDPPDWTVKPTDFDTGEAKAFCGLSQNMSSEAQARDNALENARKQIIDAMGAYGKHVIDAVVSSIGTTGSVLDPSMVCDDANRMVSEGKVKARAGEYHVEKWYRVKPGQEIQFFYKAYVLVMWNNQDAEDAVAEAIRKQYETEQSEDERRNIERAVEQMKRLQSEDW